MSVLRQHNLQTKVDMVDSDEFLLTIEGLGPQILSPCVTLFSNITLLSWLPSFPSSIFPLNIILSNSDWLWKALPPNVVLCDTMISSLSSPTLSFLPLTLILTYWFSTRLTLRRRAWHMWWSHHFLLHLLFSPSSPNPNLLGFPPGTSWSLLWLLPQLCWLLLSPLHPLLLPLPHWYLPCQD